MHAKGTHRQRNVKGLNASSSLDTVSRLKYGKRPTASSSGDCKARDRNSDILPSLKLFICKQRDCKGVLKISGS